MKLLLWLLVGIVAVAVYLWYRQRRAAPSPAALPPSNRFHAVTIHATANACPEVRALVAKKYLAKEAPRLPLDNCSAATCQCRYDHYDDRRTEDRRDEQNATQYQGEQKRVRKDRRKANA